MYSLLYLSKMPGIGGSIKNSPDDFIVEEIGKDGTVFEIDGLMEGKDEEGNYTHFILQKREWTTEGAIRRIAKQLQIGKKRFNYAGNKDKIALSTQLVSVFKIEKEKILSLDLKDIRINGAWSAKEKIKLGELQGNRFIIKVRGAVNGGKVNEIYGELDGRFPNYFGEQRFGTTRKNTHLIGEQLLRGRYDKAAMLFLSDSKGESNEEAKTARGHLEQTEDFSAALKEFPKYLRLERSMLEHLSKNPNDYVGALRALPRGTLLMFVHAFQSYLFNRILSDRIAEGEIKPGNSESGNIIGYETEPNEREKALLEELEIKTKDFKIKGIPELSSKGNCRTLLATLKNFSFENDTFRFSLPAGSYATVALREFLDVKKT